MIPVRVHLNGFMSYREPGEFLFDGAPLWMLAGPNGAGKSTVFDAITFALFGETRAGSTNYRELINHHCDNLVAEIDFRIGEDVYRVKRTINRRNKSTFQAWHLSGPNPPPGKAIPGEARAIPDAESKTGLESWVREVLGLDRETFSTSVLLRQGKSDALLNAEPRERHRMLAQIVGLKAYENLHKRVVELQRDAKGAADFCQSKLQSIEPVDEDRLLELARVMDAADDAKNQARTQSEEWTRLLVHCRAWHELQSEQNEIEARLATARGLIAQAPQIRADLLRFADLQNVLPRLRELWQVREKLATCERAIEQLTRDASEAQNGAASAQITLDAARARQNEIALAQRDWLNRRSTADGRIAEYAEPLAQLNHLAELRRESAELSAQLNEFSADLEERLIALQAAVAEHLELKSARPWLEQFVQAREDWKSARADGKKAKEEQAHWQTQMAQWEPQTEALTAQENAMLSQANEAREELGQARARGHQIKESEARLHSVENQPMCSYCGQPLTEEHLDAERGRLRDEKAVAQRDFESAVARQKFAESELVRVQRERESAIRSLGDACRSAQDTERAFAQAKEMSKSACSRGLSALEQLPERWRVQIDTDGSGHLETCFRNGFPSSEDIDEVRRSEREGAGLSRELSALQEQVARRRKIAAQSESLDIRRAPLEAKFSAEVEAQVRESARLARDDKMQSETQLRDLAAQLQGAERDLSSAQDSLESAHAKRQNAADALAAQRQLQSVQSGAAESLEANLSAEWQKAARELSDVRLSEWESEATSLTTAPQRVQELEKAEHDDKSLQIRLLETQNKLDDVPREARRAPEEIQAAQHTADLAYSEAETQWRDAAAEQTRLESDKKQRAQAEADFHVQTHRAQLLKILAEYLGPDKLQRYLLQEAENAIVAHSNQVLDRISNGTLRLELRANAATTTSKEPTALDMVAFNSETSEQPLPVALLSGSQRFRVAVAVALGMGQFASQGTRRIESVIIDEGFGSLDRDGRREMIDELHSLKSVLQRIILVSHQEEFSDAFPNRYAIELRDGASHVTLVDER